nr:cubilin isoform X2 [Oryctolagus cuniculus]
MRAPPAVTWVLIFSAATVLSTAWSKDITGCGGYITEPWGRILSYTGPDAECTWTVQVTPGHQVLLTVPVLNLTCEREKLEILDGSLTSPSYENICRGVALSYRSSSNIITIKYSREADQTPSFFEIYYYGDPQGGADTCGGVLTDPTGKLSNSPSPSSSCVWNILVQPMQRIRLQLPALGLTCPDEHVEILDGFVLSESLGKICQGSALLYQSTSNVVTVKYTRIPSRQPTPFEALYSSVSAEPDELQARAGGPAQCVGLFTRSSGRLVKHARGQRGCVWIIRVQPSYLVHLSFPLLRLDCKQERVEILDGYPGSVSLGTACTGSSLAYLSSSNTMTVIYNSTSNYSPTFFDAYYHSDLKETETCGGHLTDLWGRLIHLPGYKASCVWVIKVKPGRRVSLAFPALNLTCENEHVEILAGTPDATSLGRICQGFSLVYQSNSNTMTVKYSTKRSGPSSFFEAYYYSDPEEVPTLPEGSDPRECENHFIDLWGRSTLSRTRTSPCIWTLVIKPTQRGNQHASFLNLTCDSEQWEILDKPFGSNSLGTICQTMSLAYQTSLNRMTLSYSSRSSPQPTLFDVHLFGESPETIESIRKKGHDDCGDHLAHSSDGLVGTYGPRIVCVWSVHMQLTTQALVAQPIGNMSCVSREAAVLDGPLGLYSLGKVCQDISFIYQPAYNHLLVSYSGNPASPVTLMDAYFYRSSKGKTSAVIHVPAKKKEKGAATQNRPL